MKYQPYREIIEIETELKEYRNLCKGKSKKYHYYLDWEAYIQGLFSKFKSNDDRENFKHYLLNKYRFLKNFSSNYTPTIILYFTIIFQKISNEFSYILLSLSLSFTIVYIILQHNKYNEEFNFYCDLLEIIKKMEEKS